MSLLSPVDQQRLRDAFAVMTRPVRLVFFSQTIGCDSCVETRRILDELPPLSDRIGIDEVNFVLEGQRATQLGVDRPNTIVLAYVDAVPSGGASTKDSRIRFVGTPSGYEFLSLVHAITLVGGGPSQLSPASLGRLARVEKPVTMHVFTTPT